MSVEDKLSALLGNPETGKEDQLTSMEYIC